MAEVSLPEDGESKIGQAQRKAGEKLSVLVGRVVDDGVGPLLSSQAYAVDRLSRARRDGRADSEAAIRQIIRDWSTSRCAR